ncbi:MAG: peptide chain release factor 1 [Pseudomonadota bacterium]
MNQQHHQLDKFLQHEAVLARKMADPLRDPAEYRELSREYTRVHDLCDHIRAYLEAQSEYQDLKTMLGDPDPEIRAMAQEESEPLHQRIAQLEQAMHLAMLPPDRDDARGAIVEIRAGTGGGEAALFAADLARMYQHYGAFRGWKSEILTASETELGGVSQMVIAFDGDQVYARLKFESGVHRVQRVPVTESSGRIHTSAATVAVLPEAGAVDIRIDDKDMRIDTYRAQGAGGQHVNTTDSAVRITHIPTGITAQCQDEKSQHKNKAKAMKILMARLYDAERNRLISERAEQRRSQIGSGDRSERIRTYNFPQGRVSDHRIDLTLYKLPKILSGEALDEFIDALVLEDQTIRLAESDLGSGVT